MENINEELNQRLKDNQTKQEELNNKFLSLPKGHINILYRNKKGYYYLTYRMGNKIKNDYLGPVGKADLNDTIAKLNERQACKKQIKELEAEEKKLKKLIAQTK